jgi:hypothetical protein
MGGLAALCKNMNPRDLTIRGITPGSTGSDRPHDPLKNHVAACPPPPYYFCASVHTAWLSTNDLAGPIAGPPKSDRYKNEPQEAAIHKARPPTPQTLRGLPSMLLRNSGQVRAPLRGKQEGWGTRKGKSPPKWAALNLDRKADPSFVRRADSLVMTTFLDRAGA